MNLLAIPAVPGVGLAIQDIAGQSTSSSRVSGGSTVVTWIRIVLVLASVSSVRASYSAAGPGNAVPVGLVVKKLRRTLSSSVLDHPSRLPLEAMTARPLPVAGFNPPACLTGRA